MNSFRLLIASLLCLLSVAALPAADTIPPIPRVLPPEGLEIPADVRTRLESRLSATKKRLEAVADDALKPDIEIFTKAVEFAILHREFYVERDFAKADSALDEANKRLDLLDKKDTPWIKSTGLVVRGYRSSIESSAQPYGLVIPDGHDLTRPCPLYVWLHGRGDKNTDLHFLQERATRPGQITPPGAIVVHPFGRHCVGWKHAGEIDVLEAIDSVKSRYKIDADRIVLIGFSMGGAGAWHIGAHYTDHFIAVSPGAGFAETARYQRLTPDRYPPEYEQKLWGLYDVPNYVRNLFNTRTIAYSGELDRQIQAARVMEEAFQSEGRTLEHLIGPGVEHKYEPKTLEELLRRIDEVLKRGDSPADDVYVQTRTLRYSKQKWIAAEGLEEHWKDARIHAKRVRGTITIETKNINRLLLTNDGLGAAKLIIDGNEVTNAGRSPRLAPNDLRVAIAEGLVKIGGQWHGEFGDPGTWLQKWPGLQGPIDDAFIEKFVVVLPSGKSKHERFQAWVDFELEHFRSRWRALMRGELATIKDVDLLASQEFADCNLILWGDPDSNAVIKLLLAGKPVAFNDGTWTLGNQSFDGNRFVPAIIYPRSGSNSYIVLNSGLTFREGHDRTNSLQNPKLPDWAIIDITHPPDALSPGRIHDAGFFDEQWQLKSPPKAP